MTKSAYHHGDLRGALLAAARQLLRATAPEQLALREVARAVGVSANAPYRHFADREALLAAVAASGYAELAARARRAVEGAPPGGAVAAVVGSALRLAREEPGLAVLMRRTDRGDAGLAGAEQEYFAWLVAAVERDVPGIAAEEGIAAAVGVRALLDGLAELERGGGLAFLDDWMRPAPAVLAAAVVAGLGAGRR